jgi:hypothetical protein
MALGDIVDCLKEVATILDARGLSSGAMMHTIQQFMGGVQSALEGRWVDFEKRVSIRIADQSGKLQEKAIIRQYDRIERSLEGVRYVETKTSPDLRNALDFQGKKISGLKADIIAAMVSPQRRELTGLTFDPETVTGITGRIDTLIKQMVEEGFSLSSLQMALANLKLVDKAGQVIRAEFNDKGELLFKDAMEVASEKMSGAAKTEMSGSPDFGPAMEVAFSPSGKLADAARDAAGATNFDTAQQSLESKIEAGVTEAMDEAGNAVAAHGAEALGSKISEGATALGDIFTAVPAMADSVTALGEAWDKPLDSTEAYMDLFRASGEFISQGVQAFQSLAGVTKIASAAQAVFNAVMAMNPIVLIVIAVVALIAGIVALIMYWEEVKASVRDNPWIPAIGLILGPLGILIGLIVLIAAHWEEVKLAVLQAANFISIQIQKIGVFFVGLWLLARQVWGAIVATAANVGIGIQNAFITIGTEIQNFFIGVVNRILDLYNDVATSVIGEFVGMEPAELIPEVELETRLKPPRDVPEINVAAAFDTSKITGGLEGRIAEQESAVAAARAEDAARRAAEAAPPPAAAPEAAPGRPVGLPAGFSAVLPPALPPGAALPRPALPGAAAAVAAAGPVDASVHVQGGITVNINAERLEVDAARLLSDEIVAQLQARLGALRAEQDFRTGVRASV